MKGCAPRCPVFFVVQQRGVTMSELQKIFPRKEILAAVPGVEFQHWGLEDIRAIADMKPEAMHEMGLATWSQAVISGEFDLDPRALAKHVDAEDPHLLRHVSRALDRKVLFDLSYTTGTLPDQSGMEPVLQALIGHLWPRRLHIADVQLLDPRKPVGDATGDQSHESLRLLGAFMENCKTVAAEVGASKITLTAAYAELLPVFERNGFSVEDSEPGRVARQYGLGIPMDLHL